MLRKRAQLALIHVAIAITLVPINSTLNRILIKEMAISATLVALMASLPYLLSPVQVAIGSYSDRHPILGLRRTPYILAGLLLCVTGVSLAPLAVALMGASFWLGLGAVLLAFLGWGMGFNLASVTYMALAAELSGEGERSRTIATMWFAMIVGIILTASSLSRLLDPYSQAALERAFLWVGLAALIAGLIGLIGLEPRSAPGPRSGERRASWLELTRGVLANGQARNFFAYMILLLAAILGQDVLLEPYGAEAFGLSVSATTRITSIWGTCVLATLLAASWLERRASRRGVARIGAWMAIGGFASIVAGGMVASLAAFYLGVILLGAGTGLSTVSNLSLMLDMTTTRIGLYIGAWGVAESLARLLGTVLGGALRDLVSWAAGVPLAGYLAVFSVEAGLLLVSLRLLRRIDVGRFRSQTEALTVEERAALAGDLSL